MRTLFKLVALVILGVAVWLAWGLLLPINPGGQKFVLLRPGYSTRHIAKELRNNGVIRSTSAFLLWHYVARPHSLKAGEYLFENSANALKVHRRLSRGDIYAHALIIPEGFNIFDIAQAVENAGLGSRQDFLRAATLDKTLVTDLDPNARSLEGYLFPDTYQFTRTQTMQDMIEIMIHHFRQQARRLSLNSNVHDVVTLASIVEKETAVPSERQLIASVYNNRLQKGIGLDADPSVIYAALLAGAYQGALHHEDLQLNSPYNTYKFRGLPPGPIANPGLESLKAAMHPATSDFLYFVSDGSGHHRFATSFEEHNHNVAMLRRTISGGH